MKSRVMLLAALATAAAGCKKEQPPAPAAPPASTTASTPAPAAVAPAPSVRKDPLAEVPPSDSTLSVFEPQEGKCQWLRVDPASQKRAPVAILEGDCKGVRIAWSPDLRKALVWFDPATVQSAGYFSADASPAGYPDEEPTPGARHRLYEVTPASGEVRSVPFPSADGEVRDLGYDAQGLLARALEPLSEEQQAQGSIVVDGKELTFDLAEQEGLPALAYAYRFGAEGQWKRVEVKTTSDGADVSLGISALEIAPEGPTSTASLESHLHNGGEEPTAEQLSRLLAFVPPPLVEKVKTEVSEGGDSWTRGTTSAGAFYVWQVTGDFTHTTGHLVFESGEQLVPAKDLGFTDGDLVSFNTQGPFLLAASERVGAHPRLYDLRTRKLVFRSDTARAVTFWPRARKKSAQAGVGSP
ncbi:hypothetical protein [Archangium sp.]|jgi:hypothetical protein|uniref:hypothetical protein n=1 Tax=Archangium sp. TaxID=1872627 RepID=UPI002ED90346